MRIPIFVSRIPREQIVANVQRACPRCQTATDQRVQRRYFSVHVNLIPMATSGAHGIYTCTRCGGWEKGPSPTTSPSIPFHHRFFGLGLLAVLVFGGLGWLTWSYFTSKAAHAEYVERERTRDAAVVEAKKAVSAAESSKKECFASVDAAMKEAIPGKVIELKAREPKDASALEGAPIVAIAHASGSEQIPIPNAKYFGDPACQITVPSDVTDYAHGFSGKTGVEPNDVLAAARALSAKAKSLASPDVVGITDYRCPDECVGVVAWISAERKKILAVVRVTKSMDHLGYQKDADELAPLLREATKDW